MIGYVKQLREILYSKGIYKKKRGVYKITNTQTGMFYIGSSNSIYKRFDSHLLALKFKKHTNYKMAIDFAKHGGESFVLEIVCACSLSVSREEIYKLEQKYIDELKPTYNIQLIVEIPAKKQPKSRGKVRRLPCVEPTYNNYKTYKPKKVRKSSNRKVKVKVYKHSKKPPKGLAKDPITKKLNDFNEERRRRFEENKRKDNPN